MIVLLTQAVPEGRIFGLDEQTFIQIGMQLLNAIVLAFALAFILYKPVKEFLDKRSEGIQGKINDADATMAKAKELIAEYENKIKDIEKERLDILEEARLQTINERELIIEEANKEAEEIKKRSIEGASLEKKKLQEESRLYIIELASLMAERYIVENIGNEEQEKIYEETLSQMEGAKWQA